jgi:hypothetical protein
MGGDGSIDRIAAEAQKTRKVSVLVGSPFRLGTVGVTQQCWG